MDWKKNPAPDGRRYASPVCKPGMQARLPRTPSYGIQSLWRILVGKCSSANYSRHQAGFDFQVIYLSLGAFRIERQKGYFGLGMFLRAAGHDWVLATSKFVDFFLFFFCGVGVELNVSRLCYVINRLDVRVNKWASWWHGHWLNKLIMDLEIRQRSWNSPRPRAGFLRLLLTKASISGAFAAKHTNFLLGLHRSQFPAWVRSKPMIALLLMIS